MNLVLHICCGVCAASVVEKLKAEGHEIEGFFYNPNIFPADEYQKRLEVARQVASRQNFHLTEVPYNPEDWEEVTRDLGHEPEGGKRCRNCYRLRLHTTWLYAIERKAEAFTTTLTVSPRKPASVVNSIGQNVGGTMFLARDFKKQNGFNRSGDLAREWELYRQHYCGCKYSLETK